MKKVLLGLLTSALMTAGLIAVSADTASAACQAYTGCIDTRTYASDPGAIKRKSRAIVCGKTVAKNGNALPVGKMQFRIERNRGKFRWAKTVNYEGGRVCVKTRKLKKPGGYSLNVYYIPRPGSVFNPSNAGNGFDVS